MVKFGFKHRKLIKIAQISYFKGPYLDYMLSKKATDYQFLTSDISFELVRESDLFTFYRLDLRILSFY